MRDAALLAAVAAAGFLMGVFFFGGLWWTVRKGVASGHAALWFMGSVLVRTSVVLAGFYWVAAPRWERMLACLGGFVLARLAVFFWTRQAGGGPGGPTRETDYASESR